jgi:hypothetical protein
LTKQLISNSIETDVVSAAEDLAVRKYATAEWLRRR